MIYFKSFYSFIGAAICLFNTFLCFIVKETKERLVKKAKMVSLRQGSVLFISCRTTFSKTKCLETATYRKRS